MRRNTFCVFFCPKEVISNRIKLFPDCTEEEWKKMENDKLAPSTSIFLIFVCNDAGDDDNNENTKFTVMKDYGVKQGIESEPCGLFSSLHLSRPNLTIIANESFSLVEWNHTLEIEDFQGLQTLMRLWSVNQTTGELLLVNESIVIETDAVFTLEDSLPSDTSITLATCVGNRCSEPTEKEGLFLPIALKQTPLNRLLLIIGLTILLIIYIITTIFCLRMVKKKGEYKTENKICPVEISESENIIVQAKENTKVNEKIRDADADSILVNRTSQIYISKLFISV